MQHATTLTVTRHDDTVEHYADVRYTLTAAGLRILTADGDWHGVDTFDLLGTQATVDRPADTDRPDDTGSGPATDITDGGRA